MRSHRDFDTSSAQQTVGTSLLLATTLDGWNPALTFLRTRLLPVGTIRLPPNRVIRFPYWRLLGCTKTAEVAIRTNKRHFACAAKPPPRAIRMLSMRWGTSFLPG